MSALANPFSEGAPAWHRVSIFGAGGFGREVAWLARQAWGDSVALNFVVDKREYMTSPVDGIEVRHVADLAPADDSAYLIAIGDPAARARCVASCESAGVVAATLVHPRAEMSARVAVGEGSIICAGVVATTNVILGRHVHINLGCTIGHDVVIGDYATVSPGVQLSGNVSVGDRVFVGTGATVINGAPGDPLTIGAGAVIAAGACVIGSVEPGALMAGIPAIRKR